MSLNRDNKSKERRQKDGVARYKETPRRQDMRQAQEAGVRNNVHLMAMCLMGVHLTGMCLMGVYLITLFRGWTATGDIAGS